MEVEERRLTAEARKAQKQLAHLPVATVYGFVEISMKEMVGE